MSTQLQTRAAVVWPEADRWQSETVDLAGPGPLEVLVRIEAAGLCHSDAHLVNGGYRGLRRPVIGGHEGAGVVEEVGSAVTLVRPGDHVVLAYMPSCGSCRACVDGMQNLCERGRYLGEGFQLDGTSRHRARGQDLSLFCMLGAFADHTVVHEASCVPVDPGLPFEELCLLGCAGLTGWGAAVHTGGVRPGDTTVVVGVGGIGAMSLKAARHAGAGQVLVIDPVPGKRDAGLRMGADAAFDSLAAALEPLRDATEGRMANQVVMAMGEGDGELLGAALALVGKRGRVVVVNVHPEAETHVRLSLKDLQSMEKQVVGCLGGSWSPRQGIAQLADLMSRGLLEVRDMVTSRYHLDQINQGYEDQAAGRNIRGVLTFG